MADERPQAGLSATRAALDAAVRAGTFGARPGPVAGVSPQPFASSVSTARPAQDEAATLDALLRLTFTRHRSLVGALVAAGTVSALIGFAVPLLSMVVFDRVIPHAAFETLWALVIGVGILLALDVRLRQARHDMGDALSIAAQTSLGGRFFQRLLGTPMAQLPKAAGPLIQPWQDTRAMTQMLPQFVAGCLVDVPFFLLATALMTMLGGWLGLVPVLGGLALAGVHLAGHLLSERSLAADARHAHRQTQMLIHAVAGAETIRTTGSGPALRQQWEQETDAAAHSGHALRGAQAFTTNGAALVLQLVIVATVVGGAYAVSSSVMTMGALSACMMLAGRAVTPVSTLLMQAFRLKQLLRTTVSVAELIASPDEAGRDVSAAAMASLPQGAIAIARLGFSYPGSSRAALEGVTLSIRAGERVALIGRSGCGKSSLLRLIARLHDASTGTIHLDGRDIRQIDPALLRRAVMLMPQDPQLFDASLEANLTAGLKDVQSEWFRHVASISGVADIAGRSAEGYSLEAGPGGNRLSGGERQAVAFARALMGKPRLLLLDEPTSVMDNDREARLVKALGQELAREDGNGLGGTGLIVATHRLSILSLVDRIICLDAGRVVADGPKEQVLRQLNAA